MKNIADVEDFLQGLLLHRLVLDLGKIRTDHCGGILDDSGVESPDILGGEHHGGIPSLGICQRHQRPHDSAAEIDFPPVEQAGLALNFFLEDRQNVQPDGAVDAGRIVVHGTAFPVDFQRQRLGTDRNIHGHEPVAAHALFQISALRVAAAQIQRQCGVDRPRWEDTQRAQFSFLLSGDELHGTTGGLQDLPLERLEAGHRPRPLEFRGVHHPAAAGDHDPVPGQMVPIPDPAIQFRDVSNGFGHGVRTVGYHRRGDMAAIQFLIVTQARLVFAEASDDRPNSGRAHFDAAVYARRNHMPGRCWRQTQLGTDGGPTGIHGQSDQHQRQQPQRHIERPSRQRLPPGSPRRRPKAGGAHPARGLLVQGRRVAGGVPPRGVIRLRNSRRFGVLVGSDGVKERFQPAVGQALPPPDILA